ncbi:RagB/SusD family nutrient uptake outer membrane protein [Robertkochia aurantiaca]|uniref:RagB/SusD family nutrient uptake outer membrane protein n=1 Tax=Robertkochia aurantiaca TaxID=2873700 RepID=UPI001CCFD60E|nr:RagB/SusD family nutrient uptake outer membrane protein [Robertkochia sp. 3YJGBD-33]
MKKILVTVLGLISLASCDVLEPEPQTSLDANNALVDAASAEGIMLGAYSSMQSIAYYGAEFVLNNDLYADNSVFQGFYDSQLEFDQQAVPITNLWVTDAWVQMYRVINSANLLIDGVDNIDDPALDRDLIYGEAHAVRALVYFDLLRSFGEFYDTTSQFGLPLLLEPIPDNDFNQIPNLERSNVSDTYNQILTDLNTAISLLEGFDDQERMNYWAALALRARVNLYRMDYQAAFADANRVITEGPFSLVPDVADVYFTTDVTSESIFDLEFNDQDQSDFNTYTIRRDEYNVDPDLLVSFEEGDARADLFVVDRSRDRTAKYLDNTNANNAKVLRLAEMYLIRSEAAVMSSNDPNAGTDDLNVLRERAGLLPLGVFATMDDYIAAMQQERRAELNFEGHRFFDLVRYDLTGEVLGLTEDFRKILPIPRNELQTHPALVQNPGYATE